MGTNLLSKQKQALEFFLGKGYSPIHAKAIVGNLMQESGPSLNTSASGDNGTAFGIAQWRLDRRELLHKKYGDKPSFEQQLEYVDYELNTNEKKAKNKLLETNNIDDAVWAFNHNYERSSDTRSSHGNINRINYAKNIGGDSSSSSSSSSSVEQGVFVSNGDSINDDLDLLFSIIGSNDKKKKTSDKKINGDNIGGDKTHIKKKHVVVEEEPINWVDVEVKLSDPFEDVRNFLKLF